MKVALVQPLSEVKKLAYAENAQLPETGLAVLASWARAYTLTQPDVIVLDPNVPSEVLASKLAKAEIAGLSDWYSNHARCMEIAARVKQLNIKTRTVVGGPNAAMLGSLILRNHLAVDYVVGCRASFDGEEALAGLIDCQPDASIPNLWCRAGDGIRHTGARSTDLEQIPLWDFAEFENADQRLSSYLASQEDPWRVSPLAVFSNRGCSKALTEGRRSYCTSCEEGNYRMLSPERFWKQLTHLDHLYGARTFYVADDVFTTSPTRVETLSSAKPTGTWVRLRAYSYLPYLTGLREGELSRLAQQLGQIGVFNLFFGCESFDPTVLKAANKKAVGVEETARVVRYLHESGVKSTIAVLFGLPGESLESLETNLRAIETILASTGEAFERLYISYAIPLRGTPLFDQALRNSAITSEYFNSSGKELALDDDPDYHLLVKLAIGQFATVDIDIVRSYQARVIEAAMTAIPEHRIGGFLL